MRDAVGQARALIERHPVTPTMPFSGWLTLQYVRRIERIAKAVELLASNRIEFEARGLLRPIFEGYVRAAFVVQSMNENGPPSERTAEGRDSAARDIWNRERRDVAHTIGNVAVELPGHFDPALLTNLEAADADAAADLEGAVYMRNLRTIAECAGIERQYDAYYGTLCHPCHNSVNASIESNLPATDRRIAATYGNCAHYGLALIDIAAQLLNDNAASGRARAAIRALGPTTPTGTA